MAAFNSRPARINKTPALEITSAGRDADFAVMTCRVCDGRSSTWLHQGANRSACPHCGRIFEFVYTLMRERE